MKYCVVVAVILTALVVSSASFAGTDLGDGSNNRNTDKFLTSTERFIGMTDHNVTASIAPNVISQSSGTYTDASANRPPVFSPVPTQYLLEGDSLKLNIRASDPDLDSVTLSVTSCPSGAIFTRGVSGSGQLVWVPNFVGPSSSDGSPFTISLLASDGKSTTAFSVVVNVLNRNRAPIITAPSHVDVIAGQNVAFDVSVNEPDFETITWKVLGEPSSASFDGGIPGHFTWTPPITDSGTKVIEFIATDPSGLADSGSVAVNVAATTLYSLSIDTVRADIGDSVTSTISLDNKLAVSGFNLLVNYDPTALSLEEVSRTSTRVDYFEYFSATLNDGGRPGNVRILGTARLTGNATPLGAGSGPIVTMRFKTASNLDLSGLSVPVKFVFLDLAHDDNTLNDSVGVKIPQTSIVYTDGEVDFNDIGTVKIGDINRNGIACEIGDAIYFTNFFINPSRYPFDLVQYASSDINGDGLLATVADLVKLITIIVSGQRTPKTVADQPLDATVSSTVDDSGTDFTYQTSFPVGGILLDLETSDMISASGIAGADPNMTVDVRQDGSHVRVLIYSMQGFSMAAGTQKYLTIAGLHNFEVTAVDLSSADGLYAHVTVASSDPTVPAGFELAQNYPNPFNPETNIEFELPAPDRASLAVYDLLGREIRMLASGEFTAGRHTVSWDGRNDHGEVVASGLYLYRLETSRTSLSRKMMLLK